MPRAANRSATAASSTGPVESVAPASALAERLPAGLSRFAGSNPSGHTETVGVVEPQLTLRAVEQRPIYADA